MDPQQLMQMFMMMGQNGQGQQSPLFRAFQQPPVYAGVPVRMDQMFDLSGIPGMGSGPQGMIGGMMLQSFLPQLMGPSYLPGQFSPTQNIYDHHIARQYFSQQRLAMERASQADMNTYTRMLRGMARMSGIEWNSEQEAAARRYSGDIAMMGPIFSSLMPEFFEQAHGIRGSAQMMTRGIFDASRYTFDPVSGRLGSTGANVGELSDRVFNQLYGPDADISRMRGLGAGRAGQMYDELVRRGFGNRAFTNDAERRGGLVEELRRPSADLSPELRTLQRTLATTGQTVEQLDSPAFQAAMRSFDASRVARRIESMAGAVSAMRDIFGDMGRPNAPMIELINGLQAMTQGGLSHMTPKQLEESVRLSYNIARGTGLGMEGMMGFSGTAAQQLMRNGLSRELAVPISQQAALYGFAFGRSGQPRGIGMLDTEQASQADITLRAQAAGSPQLARLGAFMRLANEFQQQNGQTGFAAGTEAAAMADAIRRDPTATTYQFGGQTRSIFMSQGQMLNVLSTAGVNPATAAGLMTANAGVFGQEAMDHNLVDRVRQAQVMDARAFATNAMNFGVAPALGRSNIPVGQRQGLSNEVSAAIFDITRGLMESNPELLNADRRAERNRVIAQQLQQRFGNRLGNMSAADIANMVSSANAQLDVAVGTPGNPYAGLRNGTNLFQLNNPRTVALQRNAEREFRSIGALQSALSSIGNAGAIARISDAIQNGTQGQTLESIIYRTLGGVPRREMLPQLSSLLREITDLEMQARSTTDPTEQERIRERIRELAPDINNGLEGGNAPLSQNAQTVINRRNASQAARAISGFSTEPRTPVGTTGVGANFSGPLGLDRIAQSVRSTLNRTNLSAGGPISIDNVPTVHVSATNLNMENIPHFVGARNDDDGAEPREMELNGTLTLVGLDTVLLAASGTDSGDPRGVA